MNLSDYLFLKEPLWTIGGAIAGIVGFIATIRTLLWRRMQTLNWLQAERFQSDTHVLRLCEALNVESPRLQMAAAALLFERIHQKDSQPANARERNAIIQAVLAATIKETHSDEISSTSPGLCKYIADSLVDVLNARSSRAARSPLQDFYWQKAQLMDAYWNGVNAKGVDFFGATLDRASLRRAELEGAIFFSASLNSAVLSGANLRGTDFRDADLRGADLSDDTRLPADVKKTEIAGIRLSGARYDDGTKFPVGLLPADFGMIKDESSEGKL